MDLFVLALLGGGLLALNRFFAANRMDIMSAFGSMVVGWRPDPWPRGVQEEDRDRPWGRHVATPGPTLEPPMPQPHLVRLRPQVRRR